MCQPYHTYIRYASATNHRLTHKTRNEISLVGTTSNIPLVAYPSSELENRLSQKKPGSLLARYKGPTPQVGRNDGYQFPPYYLDLSSPITASFTFVSLVVMWKLLPRERYVKMIGRVSNQKAHHRRAIYRQSAHRRCRCRRVLIRHNRHWPLKVFLC